MVSADLKLEGPPKFIEDNNYIMVTVPDSDVIYLYKLGSESN